MSSGPSTDLIVERIISTYPDVQKVVLFGSCATGVYRPDSDFDLLVVVESNLSPARRAAQLRLAFAGINASFDLLVVTPDEYRRLRTWKSSVVHIADVEGRLLHEAA
jgi:uncharacterized protein